MVKRAYKWVQKQLLHGVRKDGFVLATNITKASEHESRYLPYMVLVSCHTGNKISRVYGDKGYRAPWNNEGRVMEL